MKMIDAVAGRKADPDRAGLISEMAKYGNALRVWLGIQLLTRTIFAILWQLEEKSRNSRGPGERIAYLFLGDSREVNCGSCPEADAPAQHLGLPADAPDQGDVVKVLPGVCSTATGPAPRISSFSIRMLAS